MVVYTSVQTRAIQTADVALGACGRSWVPVRRSWRLNSNHYGTLQGRGKAEVRMEAGEEQYMRWRRGSYVRPPQGEPDDDPRYAASPLEAPPRGESLHDVTLRLLPYGNTLRPLFKHLGIVSDDAVIRARGAERDTAVLPVPGRLA